MSAISKQLYTYRARSLAEAMKLVRAELGPDAAVLHTRFVGSSLAGLLGMGTLEVTASNEVEVPCRLPQIHHKQRNSEIPRAEMSDYRRQVRQRLRDSMAGETSLVEKLSTRT